MAFLTRCVYAYVGSVDGALCSQTFVTPQFKRSPRCERFLGGIEAPQRKITTIGDPLMTFSNCPRVKPCWKQLMISVAPPKLIVFASMA